MGPSPDGQRMAHPRPRVGLLTPRLPPSSLLSPREASPLQPQPPQSLAVPTPPLTPTGLAAAAPGAGGSRGRQGSQSGVAAGQLGTAGVTPVPPSSRHAVAVAEIAGSELEVEGEVGRGGFARVFAARWRGTRVALKVLDPEACNRCGAIPGPQLIFSCVCRSGETSVGSPWVWPVELS